MPRVNLDVCDLISDRLRRLIGPADSLALPSDRKSVERDEICLRNSSLIAISK